MKKALLFTLVSLFVLSCNKMANSDHPDGNSIALEWEFRGNNITEGYFSSTFTLINNSEQTLGNKGWSLYFNQMGRGVLEKSVTGHVQITHVNGDLLKITPTSEFKLGPGERVEISFNKPGWLIKENESPLGPYVVYGEKTGNQVVAVAIKDYTIRPFPPLDMIYPGESGVPIPDEDWVYEQNRNQVLLTPGNTGRVIPTPVKSSQSGKQFSLKSGVEIHFEEGLEREAAFLASSLGKVMGAVPRILESSETGPNVIGLHTNHQTGTLGQEGYTLHADPKQGLAIKGGGFPGVFYGIQSLLSMLPIEVWATPQATIKMEVLNITDQPAFGYRGMHLDIARNYLEPEAIKKLIRVMAFYKMNKLHLHITDDEGWRLEIPSLPELTEVGGYRGHTVDNKDHIGPNYGSGPDPDPGAGHGSGFLSRQAFIEILRFAADHHMEVIPEINFPGHARSAIYAMEKRYERLMEEGKEEEALKYRLIDPDDASVYNSAQNFDDNVICVCNEAPYLFYETVVDEILGMYQEAGLKMRVMHAGADEVPGGSWSNSPICKAFLESHPEVGESENLQAYFEGRLFEILKARNLVMAGWEEIAMKKNDEGFWIPNPEFVGDQMLPFVWNSSGEYMDLANRLANAGYPIILCNVSNFYFDLGYNHHPQEPGHYWGGYVNTRRAYEFIPYDVFKSTLTDKYLNPIDANTAFEGLEQLKPEAYKNIVGLQGQLWSEFIKGGEMLEYFYMPKLIGLAERAWCGQLEWGEIDNVEDRQEAISSDWNEFANRIGQRELPRLDYLFGGFNYRLPPPGIRVIDGKVYANIDFPGLTVRYTTDGTEPDVDSPVYEGPLEVTGTVQLRSFDTRSRGSRISKVTL